MQGLRVGVTGARKGAQLCAALQRRGAEVLWGPTLAPDVPAPRAAVREATERILRAGPAWVVASTGVGVCAWLDAADRAGQGGALRALLGAAVVVARGPKAHAALQAAGVQPAFVSPQETDADVACWLARRVPRGDALAVQVHGACAAGDPYGRLSAGGVRVLRVAPYGCHLPADVGPAQRLVGVAVAGGLDVVTATSAPAVANLFVVAAGVGLQTALTGVLRGQVAAAAVGAVTAAAFEEAGVPVRVMPTRARTGDLVAALERWAARGGLPNHAQVRLVPSLRVVQVGDGVAVLGSREFAVLAALVRRPGVVCSSTLLAREAWGAAARDAPAQVKHAVARIRRKLGAAGCIVETVRGAGYRYWPVTTNQAVTPGP